VAGTSYSDSGLTTGTAYSYTVAACDAAGNCSAQSVSSAITTQDTQAPTVPVGLVANPVSGSQVNLIWTAATDNVAVTQYKVYRGGVLLTTLGVATSYTDSGLVTATAYSYVVMACDAAGNCSPQSAVATTTTLDNQAPSIPGGLLATVSSGSQVNLLWNASTDNVGVVQYKIYRGGILLTPVGGAVTSYSDSGLAAGTTYSYTMAACDAAGNCSVQGVAAVAITQDTQPPTVPAGVTATAVIGSKINIAWSASTDNVGVTSYKLYRGGVLLATLGAVTGYNDSGLISATTYSYTVAACDAANNCSTQSSGVSAIADAGAVALNLVASWNLLGNSVNAPLTVAASFGNAVDVSKVWKWVPATSKWAFYTPSLADGGAAYALSKGYDFLTVINGGEGFWVNAKVAFTTQLPIGAAVNTSAFADQMLTPNMLPLGWSLISIGDNRVPRSFVNAIALTPPATPNVVATSLTTLWAWDSALSNWYFYAPSLDNSGGLDAYITTKGYLNFGTKVLDPAMGFWVNHP
jgi:chitodextrinase